MKWAVSSVSLCSVVSDSQSPIKSGTAFLLGIALGTLWVLLCRNRPRRLFESFVDLLEIIALRVHGGDCNRVIGREQDDSSILRKIDSRASRRWKRRARSPAGKPRGTGLQKLIPGRPGAGSAGLVAPRGSPVERGFQISIGGINSEVESFVISRSSFKTRTNDK